MQLQSVSTPLGAALLVHLVEPLHPIEAPEGFGLIFRGTLEGAALAVVITSSASWIATYSATTRQALVALPKNLEGKRFPVASAEGSVVCPDCGSPHYTSSGSNWRCSKCDRQWRKVSGGVRGRPRKAS